MDLTRASERVTTFPLAVKQVSALAHAKLPQALHGALERATALVLHRHVWLDEDGRHAQVLSSDGQTWYRVNGQCTCRDAPRAPQGSCKHKLAVQLYKRAGEVLTASCGRTEPAAAGTPCPEALFSACLRGTVKGIDTQLTARGQTFPEFQRHVDAVHALFDAPAARPAGEASVGASAPAPGETPTCLYHGPMKASTKAPGTFFCTKKLADGSYCPSRHPER